MAENSHEPLKLPDVHLGIRFFEVLKSTVYRSIKAHKKNCSKSEIHLKLARKADNRLFLSFVVKKVVESV